MSEETVRVSVSGEKNRVHDDLDTPDSLSPQANADPIPDKIHYRVLDQEIKVSDRLGPEVNVTGL